MNIRTVAIGAGSKPRSACCRLRKLRAKSAAPTSSTIDSATSPTTSAWRARLRAPPSPVRPPSRRAATRLLFATCAAGVRPKTSPVSTLMAIV